MPRYFTPPTDAVVPPAYVGPGAAEGKEDSHLADTSPAIQTLMERYAQGLRGRNVWLMEDGSVTENEPPQWNPDDPTGPVNRGWNPFTHAEDSTTLATSQQVRRVFWGATDNPITAEEETILTAAGYAGFIHS